MNLKIYEFSEDIQEVKVKRSETRRVSALSVRHNKFGGKMKKISYMYFLIFSLFWHNGNLFPQNITAKYIKAKVDSVIDIINPYAKLHLIFTDSVFIDGTSLSWKYQYNSFFDDTTTNYFFRATYDSVVFDSINHSTPLGSMDIDSLWIDSDSALAVAESQGGYNFRYEHTNYKITACLGKPLIPITTNHWYISYISLDDPSDRLLLNIKATENEPNDLLENKSYPIGLFLYQNYPNPFNPYTMIKYMIPQTGYVELSVYNILGKEIRTLVKENKNSGDYLIEFDGSKIPNGIYYYVLKYKSITKVNKFILLK